MELKRRLVKGITDFYDWSQRHDRQRLLTRPLLWLFVLLRRAVNVVYRWLHRRLDRFITAEEREQLHTIIHRSETPQGQLFDTVMTWMILLSVLAVVMETVSSVHNAYWWALFVLEWFFTILFTIEYILKLYSSRQPFRYATSFFGVVDLLSIVPTYLSVFFLGAQHLLIMRALRLLRMFRILKMGHFVKEGSVVVNALQASRTKIYVFLMFVVLMAVLIGTVLYMVEGGSNPQFSNIPKGIYWAIVTLTTVGYGDVTPVTPFGKMLATVVMLLGYGIIAVPTGIVTAEISSRVMHLREVLHQRCRRCGQEEHFLGARYCQRCGSPLD